MKKIVLWFTDHGKLLIGILLVLIGLTAFIFCTFLSGKQMDDTAFGLIMGTGTGLAGWHTFDHLSDPPAPPTLGA